MKRTRNPRTLRKTLKRWLVLPVLILWFLSMALLTWAVGRDLYIQLEEEVEDWGEFACRLELLGVLSDLPGALDMVRFQHLTFLGYEQLDVESLLPIVLPQNIAFLSSDNSWENWEIYMGCQSALGYYNEEGQKIIASGNYMYFNYTDAVDKEPCGYAYIDLNTLPGGDALAKYISPTPFGDTLAFHSIDRPFQMTGWFEGNQFFPVEISNVKGTLYKGDQPDRLLVTIFVYSVEGYRYEPGGPFYWNGAKYGNAAVLLEKAPASQFGFMSAVICREWNARCGGSVRIAVWCSPLEYAATRLWPVYLASFLLVALCLRLILIRIRWTLVEPMNVINHDLRDDRTVLTIFSSSPFAELQELRKHIDAVQQERHQSKNQVRQLETALNYARNAEENRRKMVSAIAHELKTPLAVIHSYAEGLQAGSAAQKQEKYLSVILEETESMDTMVLEMLDLSRLEAGKVQLSMDQFSLTGLTRSIFEKLALAMKAKQLQIKYLAMQELFVTADEFRISQVITNLATNAVKYTPQGGLIRVRLFHSVGQVHFCIENTGPQLSQEALSQVWDTFYRADTARAGSGTGLGLAIVKNIVELHRGTCSVQNTNIGVEFRFQIPM